MGKRCTLGNLPKSLHKANSKLTLNDKNDFKNMIVRVKSGKKTMDLSNDGNSIQYYDDISIMDFV